MPEGGIRANRTGTRSQGVIVMALVVVLLVSLDSETVVAASARARMYQGPGVVPGGMVRDVEDGLFAPDARIGTLRLLRARSVASHVVLAER